MPGAPVGSPHFLHPAQKRGLRPSQKVSRQGIFRRFGRFLSYLPAGGTVPFSLRSAFLPPKAPSAPPAIPPSVQGEFAVSAPVLICLPPFLQAIETTLKYSFSTTYRS